MTEVKSYLSNISAACAWEIPYLHTVFGCSSIEQLIKTYVSAEQRCAVKQNERIRTQNTEAHYKVLSLPQGSVTFRKGERIASPELVFLSLANQLGFHRTVLLGMQLCSSDPNGRLPLTTTNKLQRFLDRCDGHHGCRIASKAARHVADNSWSVMESLLYLLLTLPNQYGGYGLKGAVLNHRITPKKKRGSAEDPKSFFADLYWEQAKLVVEYDSYAFHNNRNMWIKDAQRLAALERNGYNALSINTAQIYSDSALEEAALVIAKNLGRRIQIRSSRFIEQKRLLRGLLPRREEEQV